MCSDSATTVKATATVTAAATHVKPKPVAQAVDNSIAGSDVGFEKEYKTGKKLARNERFGPAFFFCWVNIACPLMVLIAGWHPALLKWCFAVWFIQMVGTLGGYHRFFSHRGYDTSRPMGLFIAFIGALGGQAGPLHWAVAHRHHHKRCEEEDDIHSPSASEGSKQTSKLYQFYWAQGGYLLGAGMPELDWTLIADWKDFPEILLIDKLAPAIYYAFGFAIWYLYGFPAYAWAYCLPSFWSWNAVQLVNSAAHMVGELKYSSPAAPKCDARNVWWLTPIMLGANWHNNHHAQSNTARAGFEWYEIDPIYYVICLWGFFGLVWNIRQPSPKLLAKFRIKGA